MKLEIPKKPTEEKDQISMLWDVVCNHLLHRVYFQNVKMNFILGILALVIALLGVVIALLGVVIIK